MRSQSDHSAAATLPAATPDTGIPHAPPARDRSWFAPFGIVWTCHTVMFVAFQSSLPFIALYIQELGVKDQASAAAWAGAINGLALAIYAVMNVVWGAVSDRWGLKAGLIRAQLFAAVGFGIAAAAQAPEHVLVARLLSSTGGGANAAALSLVGMLVPSGSLGLTMGFMQTGASLGGTLGPAFGGVLGDLFGFRFAFLVAAAIAVVMAVSVWLFVREPSRPPRPAGGEGLFAGFHDIVQSPVLRDLMLLLVVFQVGYQAVLSYIPLRLQELVAAEEVGRWSGAALIGDALGIALGAALLGWLSDRMRPRPLLVIATVVALGATAAHLAANTPEPVIALRFLLGLCSGGFLSIVRALLGSQANPSRRGLIFGVSQGAFSGAISLASILGSLAIQVAGLAGTFMLSTLVLAAAAVWTFQAAAPARLRTR